VTMSEVIFLSSMSTKGVATKAPPSMARRRRIHDLVGNAVVNSSAVAFEQAAEVAIGDHAD
jgi:hypothetical protein